ncbi:MAG TPA: hypothetical protein EYQ63_09490, partial [Fuerstia sp.]|nr:hypothetical protein [Fuerstiella sp.]
MTDVTVTTTSFNRVPTGLRGSSQLLIFSPFARRLTVAAATVLCFALFGVARVFTAERPNILLIVSEDNGP